MNEAVANMIYTQEQYRVAKRVAKWTFGIAVVAITIAYKIDLHQHG